MIPQELSKNIICYQKLSDFSNTLVLLLSKPINSGNTLVLLPEKLPAGLGHVGFGALRFLVYG